MAGENGRHHEACDHHQPDDGRCGRPALGSHPLGEQHQKRGSARPDADADRAKGEHCQRDSGPAVARHPGRRRRGPDAAQSEDGHAADDPGRAALSPVGTIAQARAQHLHRIVKCDQGARQQRRQREFHHHHPVDGRGRKHHDRAECGLHEADAHDAKPAERAWAGLGASQGAQHARLLMD